MECLDLLRLSELIFSLAVLGAIVLLVIQADVLPINKAIEPSDLNFLGLVLTCTLI